MGAAHADSPGRGSRRGLADPPRWPPFGPRGPPSTCSTGGTEICQGGPSPPPAPAGGGKVMPFAGTRATGLAGPGQGWPPPRRAASGAMCLRRRSTLGSPIGRGPLARVPRRSVGTRHWRACRGPTPGPPSAWLRPGARAAASSRTPWRLPAVPRLQFLDGLSCPPPKRAPEKNVADDGHQKSVLEG